MVFLTVILEYLRKYEYLLWLRIATSEFIDEVNASLNPVDHRGVHRRARAHIRDGRARLDRDARRLDHARGHRLAQHDHDDITTST